MNKQSTVGSKIKALRELKNMDLETLAERTQLSKEQIEIIEQDKDLPSLAPLIKIARVLGVRLGTFLDDAENTGAVVCRRGERYDSISFSNNSQKTRNHMQYHALAQSKEDKHIEPFIIDINPEENQDYKLSAHEGEEFIYVMEGEVEVVYGKEKYSLKEGDSIYYDSIVKHHLHGAPGKSAKILALIYIPF